MPNEGIAIYTVKIKKNTQGISAPQSWHKLAFRKLVENCYLKYLVHLGTLGALMSCCFLWFSRYKLISLHLASSVFSATTAVKTAATAANTAVTLVLKFNVMTIFAAVASVGRGGESRIAVEVYGEPVECAARGELSWLNGRFMCAASFSPQQLLPLRSRESELEKGRPTLELKNTPIANSSTCFRFTRYTLSVLFFCSNFISFSRD